jgi:hypothetical protein
MGRAPTPAGLTAVEAIRQPICLLLTTTCVVLTALIPLIAMHNFGEDGKLVRDSGLAFHLVFGLFVAGYAACSSLATEMRSGTASAVLSKPVGREVFFLAKFVGVAIVVVAFSACATLTTLLSERVAEKFYSIPELTGYITDWQTGTILILAPFVAYLIAGAINYVARRPFGSTAFGLVFLCLLAAAFVAGFFDRTGHRAPFDLAVEWRILPASLLVTLALIVLSAIAMAMSTRLSTVPTLTFSGAILAAGLMSDYWLGEKAAISRIAGFFYRIIPNWQHFWLSDALSNGGTIPWTYVIGAAFYAAAYSAGILCLGLLSFRHVEMK